MDTEMMRTLESEGKDFVYATEKAMDISLKPKSETRTAFQRRRSPRRWRFSGAQREKASSDRWKISMWNSDITRKKA